MAAVMRDFKRHCADRLVRQLRVEGNEALLERLARRDSDGKLRFQVWDEGYQAKDVISRAFLLQKLEYIHHNPCQPRWQLSESPADYPWSSARFYLTDEPSIIPVDDARKILG